MSSRSPTRSFRKINCFSPPFSNTKGHISYYVTGKEGEDPAVFTGDTLVSGDLDLLYTIFQEQVELNLIVGSRTVYVLLCVNYCASTLRICSNHISLCSKRILCLQCFQIQAFHGAPFFIFTCTIAFIILLLPFVYQFVIFFMFGKVLLPHEHY